MKSEGEAPIVRGEPIAEERPPLPREEPLPHAEPPQPLRARVNTERPLGDLPLGQEASEPDGEGGGAPEGEGGVEETETGLETVYEREEEFQRELRDQGIFETVDGYGQARAG